ncbi:MAG: thioredoxin family protein [Bacteroidetes bacterium QS_9_68_14]|nr:MAG: thioredoxin family protein [Bacteroidetes bacterium QS_9_68_14]
MALTESQMTALGDPAPAFDLPAANPGVAENPTSPNGHAGPRRALEDFAEAEALVVVFTCNHCPYAQHVEPALVEMAREYQERGVAFVAISANDARSHPEDSFENMAARAEEKSYPFPYLYDESQDVARAYGAACTPDFFVYGPERQLAYRGRFDATRPNKGTPTGDDLRAALDDLLEKGAVEGEQHPSVGCNIKWRSD